MPSAALPAAVAGLVALAVAMGVGRFAFTPLLPLMTGGGPVLGGVLYSGVGGGIALAGCLCLALMALRVSSAHTWLALGVVSLVLAACVWPLIGDGSAVPRARERSALRWTPDM